MVKKFLFFGKNIIFSTSLGFIDFNINKESIGDGNIISLWDSKKESIGLYGEKISFFWEENYFLSNYFIIIKYL